MRAYRAYLYRFFLIMQVFWGSAYTPKCWRTFLRIPLWVCSLSDVISFVWVFGLPVATNKRFWRASFRSLSSWIASPISEADIFLDWSSFVSWRSIIFFSSDSFWFIGFQRTNQAYSASKWFTSCKLSSWGKWEVSMGAFYKNSERRTWNHISWEKSKFFQILYFGHFRYNMRQLFFS